MSSIDKLSIASLVDKCVYACYVLSHILITILFIYLSLKIYYYNSRENKAPSTTETSIILQEILRRYDTIKKFLGLGPKPGEMESGNDGDEGPKTGTSIVVKPTFVLKSRPKLIDDHYNN
ncbi:hypothetical protein SNEBB_007943 [Seison nebaliae]|nr:hypothetical protein SNEBB_007943 [Seison nebaliae]